MTPLHAPTTRHTAADMHLELAHVRPHNWQIFLNLRGDACFAQPAAAIRACFRKWDVNAFVDRGGRLPVGMAPVPAPGAPARPARLPYRRTLRKRRRLPLARAPRRVQRPRQPLDLAPQALQLTLGVIARARGRALPHATVTADSGRKYKPNIWIGVVTPLTSYPNSSGVLKIHGDREDASQSQESGRRLVPSGERGAEWRTAARCFAIHPARGAPARPSCETACTSPDGDLRGNQYRETQRELSHADCGARMGSHFRSEDLEE